MTELIIAKILVTVCFVIGLSIIAERISPRWAGILSGYPTGTAISLFFFGLEISPRFAADSVTYNLVGLIATFCFSYTYYQTSRRYKLIPSIGLALLTYTIVVTTLHIVPFNNITATGFALIGVIVFTWLFRGIKNATITERVKLSPLILLLRGLAAATIVLIITGAAHVIGPVWSGLLSSFPTTLLPLMIIIQLTYNKAHAHTIIKNTPTGNVAIVLYSLTVAVAYPTLGIYVGTLLAFSAATLYLVIYQLIQQSVKLNP